MENLYLPRINRVMDYVNQNLCADLSLKTLADMAHFSPFHFHRIFKNTTGETLNQYVNRVRIERAMDLLRSDSQIRIIDAAFACGYESAEGFSRAFKKRYGFPPDSWQRDQPIEERKIGQALDGFPVYTVGELIKLAESLRVEIFDLPEQRLAYIRVLDSYNNWQGVVEAHDRLMDWYLAQGGTKENIKLYGMSQDDPDLTPMELCRFDWCIAIPDDWTLPEHISERQFPRCTVAAIHAEGDLHVLDRIIQFLWRYWLPCSHYQPDNLPAMEIYRQLPIDIGWEEFDLWSAVPITRFP